MDEEKDLKKEGSGNWKNIVIIILCLVIVGLVGFMLLNNNEKSTNKEDDKTEQENVDKKEDEKDDKIDSEENTDKPEEQEKEDDNTISQELRRDLDKRAELSKFLAMLLIFKDDTTSVIAENTGNDYEIDAEIANITYDYYIYKSGKEKQKYVSYDSNFSTCYDQAQNGYCYVGDKEEVLKYEKEFFNLGEKVFKLNVYAVTKNDKIYVTPVALGGSIQNLETISVVSVTKNADKSISYVVNYYIGATLGGVKNQNINVNYTFKLNNEGNYYLYAISKI